jgi:hypothetical protein
VLAKTPLINKAVAARFMMFAFLIFAIITAQWFATSSASLRGKWFIAMLVILFSLANLDGRFWLTKSDTLEFFTNGLYKKYLEHGENVLVTPYALRALRQQHALAGSKRILLPHGGRMDRSIAGGI